MDEVGSDNNLAPLRGWSLKGQKTYAEKLGFKTKRLSMVSAYRAKSKEMIAPFEYTGYTDLSLFTGWFEQILCPQLKAGDYVIMDNAKFHKSEEILDIAREYNITVIYLPAYSPDLNSIEHVWANFKRNLRKIIKKCADFQEAITLSLDKTLSG